MKTITLKNWQIFLVIVSSFFIFSCEGDDSNNGSTQPEVKNINDIILTFTSINTPATPEDSGNFTVWFSMIGDKVFYANPSNTGLDQFMLEYDISDNQFTNKMADTEVCACGFSSVIVNDGMNLFYITNGAVKYSTSTDTWTTLDYPNTFRDNNGETGIVYHNGKIYFYGGRTATKRFKYYEISTDSWQDAPEGPYETTTSEMVSLGSTIYSIGGTTYTNSSMESIDNKRKFSAYTEGGGWTTLTDLPFDLQASWGRHLVTSLNNRFIFVLTFNGIQVYDTMNEVWKDDPIPVEVEDINQINLFSYDGKLFLVGKSSTNDFRIYEVEAQLPVE